LPRVRRSLSTLRITCRKCDIIARFSRVAEPSGHTAPIEWGSENSYKSTRFKSIGRIVCAAASIWLFAGCQPKVENIAGPTHDNPNLTLPVLSESAAKSHDGKTWVSNGPYVLSSCVPGGHDPIVREKILLGSVGNRNIIFVPRSPSALEICFKITVGVTGFESATPTSRRFAS
jgi:hypothetical protein